MRIVLAPVGTRGDVQPMLGLAVELLRRGHDVTLCVAENFRALVEATGARYHEGGNDPQRLMTENGEGISSPFKFLQLARIEVEKQFGFLESACKGADVVVGTMLLAAGQTIAEQIGAKYFGAAYFPQVIPTRELLPPIFGHPATPRFLIPFAWWAMIKAGDRALLGLVNAERKKRGLGEIESLVDERAVKKVTLLCAFDDALASAPADWNIEHHTTGFWFYDDGPPLPDDLARFLDDGDPPVFIGFGSMPANDPARTTRTISEAVAQNGCRAIVGAGWASLGGGLASDRVFVVEGGVDHRRLFPRCAAIVHHGGAGTTAQAARASAPQVIVPHMFDQHHWAARVQAVGVGPKPLSVRFSSKQLAAAIDVVRSDAAMRANAAALGTALSAANGVDRAAGVDRALALT